MCVGSQFEGVVYHSAKAWLQEGSVALVAGT